MIVVMQDNATLKETGEVIKRVEGGGFQVHLSKENGQTVMGVVGRGAETLIESLRAMNGVETVIEISPPYKLASRQYRRTSSVIDVNGVAFGGDRPVVIAGPCAVESREQLRDAAHAVKAAGASMLRGGAFKPRTSPYSFRGLGVEGLQLLREIGDETGLPVCTEILSASDIDDFMKYADVLQIGARNMQNFTLLDVVGEVDKPVLLKRGMMSTIDELLLSAEYILARGNERVILCERGIRTFETATRNTPDIAAIPVVKHLSHLPIVFDPSHTSGQRRYVSPFARAGIAAGADGLIIEVHPRPKEALCDGSQALLPEDFEALMAQVDAIVDAIQPREPSGISAGL